jgi:hypothetical protein
MFRGLTEGPSIMVINGGRRFVGRRAIILGLRWGGVLGRLLGVATGTITIFLDRGRCCR